jgi:hypothetical protein
MLIVDGRWREVVWMHRRPVGLGGRICPCGGRITHGRVVCGKCTARARWQRRKTRREPYGEPDDSE